MVHPQVRFIHDHFYSFSHLNWANIASIAGTLNDVWKAEIIPTCPPLHYYINRTCVPILQCDGSSSNASCSLECDSSNTNCSLECDSSLMFNASTEKSGCLIEGDMTVEGSNTEEVDAEFIVTIIGVVNVTGNVTITRNSAVKLSPGSVLHVAGCMALDAEAKLVVEVNDEVVTSSRTVIATYDASCTSSDKSRVSIESWVDECQHGRPVVDETREGRRAKLELLFVPISDSSECGGESDSESSSGNEVNMLIIVTVVPAVVVILIVMIVVVATVPKIRRKLLPYHDTE